MTIPIKTLIFIFLVIKLPAQTIPKWYDMQPELDIEGTWCVYSSIESDSVIADKLKSEVDFVANPTVSSFNLTRKDTNATKIYKNEIFGIRGQINEREILIIDSDLDRSMKNERVIYLPKLKKLDTFNYESKYIYNSKINQNYPIQYEQFRNGQLYQKKTNIGINVYHKYDEVKNELYYLNNYRLCYNQKLVFNGILDGQKIRISCYDNFPWVTIIRFKMSTPDHANERVNIKTPFKVNENGKLFQIDSVDFINNKILIKTVDKIDKIFLSSESLFSDNYVNTDSLNYKMKVIHVWGSWCKPCVRNLPKLVKLKKAYRNVEFIGICEDNNKDRAAKLATEQDVLWKNLHYKMNAPEIDEQLNIISYPTYLLIKENKIQERFESIEKLEEYLAKDKLDPTDNK